MHLQTTRNISSKKIFLTVRSGVKNVFFCICAYLQTTRNFFVKKDFFYHLVWLKACFDAFAHTSRTPETYCLEQLQTCFDAFSQASIPPETFFQKRYFLLSGVVPNVFLCIFAHTSRPPETFFQKRYFLPPGVVNSVFWCISTYFQTNRNFFSKEIIFTVWSGYKRVLMHFRILPYHQKPFFRKDIFYCLEWLKTFFYAFAHTSRPPDTFFRKDIFDRLEGW